MHYPDCEDDNAHSIYSNGEEAVFDIDEGMGQEDIGEYISQDEDQYDELSETEAQRMKRFKYDCQSFHSARREHLNYPLLKKKILMTAHTQEECQPTTFKRPMH